MDIEVVADLTLGCGECPTWHPETEKLFFTDVDSPVLYSYDPARQSCRKVYEGDDVVGGMTLHEDGRLLLFMSGGAIRLWSVEGEFETLLEGIEGEEDSRFNDVVADPRGRVYCGTMPTDQRPGKLYRWDPDGSLTVLLHEVGLPNGMDFSPDLKWFYFTDTDSRTVKRFKYQQATGEIEFDKNLIEVTDDSGNPDGLTVDLQGRLWSARYGGNCLVCYSPEGEEMRRIEIAVTENVTCPVFGGPELRTLYVTTAGGPHRPQAGEAAGSLLRLDPETGGRAAFRSRNLR